MPVVALTHQYLRRLKPPASGRVEIWDEKTPGLCLRLSASGAASWSFRYRPREGTGFQRVTLGTLAALGLSDARDRAARHRAAVVDGADPQRERVRKRVAARNVLTFDKLAERYLEEYAKPRKASWRNDQGYLGRPRDRWRDKPAAEITRRDVIDLLDEIRTTAPVSANRIHSVLVTLFGWAVDGELLEANPVTRLKKRTVEVPKDRALSDNEIRVLWRVLSASTGASADVSDALRLLLLTGQRPGEIAGLERAEIVDLRGFAPRLEIAAGRMKGRRAHLVPLSPMAQTIVEEAIRRREILDGGDPGAVFASRFSSRQTLARHSLSQALRRITASLAPDQGSASDREAVRTLKSAPATPHDFRRTVATGLARLGISREDRKAVLGHAEDDIHGRHYDRHERAREKRAALERWADHVSELIGEAPHRSKVVSLLEARR